MTNRDERRSWRVAISGAVWALYGLSLAVPVLLDVYPDGRAIRGYEALVTVFSPGSGVWLLPGLANVALLAGWVGYVIRQNTLAVAGGLVSVALSMSTLLILADGRSPFQVPFVDLQIGFWLWLGAMLLMSAGAVVEFSIEMRAVERGAQ